jgi:hypothetical protein
MTFGTPGRRLAATASLVEVPHMLKWTVGLAAGVAVSAAASYQLVFKPWRRAWAASPEDATRALPGDDLVPDAEFNETMEVTIEAPPSAVWPWLLQLGYGRGGWYSYDLIDMEGHSAREIVPEFQALEVGQMVPIAPGAGFRVSVVEQEHALVLYADNELFEGQPATGELSAQAGRDKMIGFLSDANMRAFRMSWAFVLEPLDSGRTRLLERFRTTTTPGPAAAMVGPLISVGHFLMTRRQMLGIKERAEAIAASAPAPQPTVVVPIAS